MIATLFFWTLFLPPLSELEGENALAQMVVFVPSIIAYPVLFPIIWLLEIFIFYNETLVLYGLAILLLSLVTPILLLVVHFIIATSPIPFLLLYIYLSILTMLMTLVSYINLKMRLSISKVVLTITHSCSISLI